MTSMGERVANLRNQRGMSQRDLAAAVNRSESWVSQVERDVIVVERIPVLQSLADALNVTVADLRGDAGEPSRPKSRRSDMDALRLAMTGHPAPAQVFPSRSTEAIDVEGFAGRVATAWGVLHESRFGDLNAQLVDLVPRIEYARRRCRAKQRPELDALTAETYQIAASAFARLGEADAAWVAADRALFTAEQAGQPLSALAGLFRMAHAFITLGRYEQAEQVTTSGIAAIDSRADTTPEATSVQGALYLALAITHAKTGNRSGARAALDEAARLAKRLRRDRNDFGTEFGPTNVQLHAVAVAVELGDAGYALELSRAIDATKLSVERQSRLWLDVARANAQRRHTGDAINALLRAEELAPEQVHTHDLARMLIRELISTAGRRPPAELAELAHRCGAV